MDSMAERAVSRESLYMCDSCGVTPIRETRWKCETCDEDLCDDCKHPADHALNAFPALPADADFCPCHSTHATAIDDAQISSLRRLRNEYGSYEGVDKAKKEIRLIRIVPATPNKAMTCWVMKYPISECKNHYTALSYTWGDFRNPRQIRLVYVPNDTKAGDDPKIVYFLVTRNLYEALEFLRPNPEKCSDNEMESTSQLFWIDALSINQGDADERSHQVSMMREIYSQADAVQIFLGGKHKNDELGGFLEGMSRSLKLELGDNIDIAYPSTESFRTIANLMTNSWEREGEAVPRQKLSGWMRELLSSPWFRRVWVIQEVYCAKRDSVFIRTGHNSGIPWKQVFLANQVYQACRMLDHDLEDHGLPLLWLKLQRAQDLAIHHGPESENQSGFMDVLELFSATISRFFTTDPRDKLFGVLGICKDIQGFPIVAPDYNESTSQAYANLARTCISRHNSLEVLSLTSEMTTSEELACKNCKQLNADQGAERHPSWAPWHIPRSGHGTASLHSTVQTSVAGDMEIDKGLLEGNTKSRILSLRGVRLDIIQGKISDESSIPSEPFPRQVLSDEPPINNLVQFWWAVQKLYDECEMYHRPHGPSCPFNKKTRDDLFEMYIETLTGEMKNIYQTSQSSSTRVWEQPGVGEQLAACWVNPPEDPEMTKIPLEAQAYLRTRIPKDNLEVYAAAFQMKWRHFEGKCFFFTRKARLGLCPTGTKIGDMVVALFGGKVLYVLRPRDGAVAPSESEPQPQFQFVGECYLHSCMDGQEVRNLCQGGGSSEVFNLS